MNAIQNFAFDEHLVRVVELEGAPWFVGKDVCGCLEIAKHHQALEALDDDERGTSTVGTPMGDQTVIVISEPGVYRLVFRSRKPSAERFKRWLAHEVLPEIRKTGRFEAKGSDATHTPAPAGRPVMEPKTFLEALYCIRETRLVWGVERARVQWRTLGLPAVPPAPPTARDEARICLRHLLDTEVSDGERSVRDFIEAALDEDENARAMLIAVGIRVYPEREAFLIANWAPRIEQIFAGTEWADGRYARVLRRLPDVVAAGTARFSGVNRRGSLIPAAYLDDEFRASEGVAVTAL